MDEAAGGLLTESVDALSLNEALLLARDEYPALDVEAYLAELDGMAHEARPHLRGSLLKRVQGLCRYLCHDMGFRGNQQEYYDARNSYLNEVLDRRTGIPITLSVVAMAVGGMRVRASSVSGAATAGPARTRIRHKATMWFKVGEGRTQPGPRAKVARSLREREGLAVGQTFLPSP